MCSLCFVSFGFLYLCPFFCDLVLFFLSFYLLLTYCKKASGLVCVCVRDYVVVSLKSFFAPTKKRMKSGPSLTTE